MSNSLIYNFILMYKEIRSEMFENIILINAHHQLVCTYSYFR